MAKIDKTSFVNITFEDNSIYYGEVAWFNEEGEEVPAPAEEDSSGENQEGSQNPNGEDLEKVPKAKISRHGNGAQIFLRQDNTVLCKYEGEWIKDSKYGNGLTMYPDGAIYAGSLNSLEKKEGYGKYVWPSGDSYNGTWGNDKMDGPGVFIQSNGNRLEGTFKNNYFHIGGDNFVNPLSGQKEIENFINKRSDIDKIKETRLNEKRFIIKLLRSRTKLANTISESCGNDRIP